jgi:predicted TIM-barrel fold metal-dependent hydrolase
LIAAVLRLTDRVPELRVILDHLARFVLPAETAARAACRADLKELAARPRVWAKVSGVLRRIGDKVPVDLAAYRGTLDEIWETFGPDRVLYGSDWPNSDLWGDYAAGFRIVREYFAQKGRAAEEKYFWKNSVDAYRWVKR